MQLPQVFGFNDKRSSLDWEALNFLFKVECNKKAYNPIRLLSVNFNANMNDLFPS